MKWTSPGHPRGATRCVQQFAWWPTALEDGKTVWLEEYTAEQDWRDGGDPFNGSYWHWHTTRAYQRVPEPYDRSQWPADWKREDSHE